MSDSSEKYEVLEKIGHGSFGVIRKVRRKSTGLVMCRKEISYLKMSQKEREQLHAEFQILSTLRHPNIVGYYHREHLKQTQDLHLYMEYCGNGDLGRIIRELADKNAYAQEAFVWSIFSQLVMALFRCHYGVDPPEVGDSVLGFSSATAKPKAPSGSMTILHRDLKPENIFLGEDNTVKLGDFGLSKMIESHDFASTYVGTPYYMSPEICAAEKYTLKSDIWSLGCIMYELCVRKPPFDAKSQFQLVQRIKEGRFAPLPAIYSPDLATVIRDCLRVNPDRRPDTAELLGLPAVRLMRKEREVVELNKMLKSREATLNKKMRELDAGRTVMRQEMDASLRREWEVKARLEIDRLVGIEIETLQKKFEEEVQARVAVQLGKARKKLSSSAGSGSTHGNNSAYSVDDEFASVTDMTELSLDSLSGQQAAALTKSSRTPFARAQTFAVHGPGTPMDVDMASPSPVLVASLSLSPRRNAGAKAPTGSDNIFVLNSSKTSLAWKTRDLPCAIYDMDSDSDLDVSDPEHDTPGTSSPTRMIRSAKNPFPSAKNLFAAKERPALPHAPKSTPVLHVKETTASAVAGFVSKQTKGKPTLWAAKNVSDGILALAVRERKNSGVAGQASGANKPASAANSPARPWRQSKKPSGGASSISSVDAGDSLSGLKKTPLNRSRNATSTPDDQVQQTQTQAQSTPQKQHQTQQKQPQPLGVVLLHKTGIVKGRTLVDLQKARAGGRQVDGGPASPRRLVFREGSTVGNRSAVSLTTEPPAVWDPERDEMPSPFLPRRRNLPGV